MLACAALMSLSSGAWYTSSVFFVALIREFGWNYASTASIFSFFTVFYGAWGILVGHLVDRIGPRRVVLGGGILLSVAMAGSAAACAIWHLYITHSILTALGLSAAGYVPVSLIITQQFRARRGLALGAASAGAGVGILALVPLAQLVIDYWGWRAAFLVLGGISGSVAIPVGLFALDERRMAPPEPASPPPWPPSPRAGTMEAQEFTLKSALCSKTYWLVTATLAFLNCPVQLVMTHHVAHLTEVGHAKLLVVGIVGLVGLFSIPGKTGWGFLSDRFCPELIYLAGITCIVSAILMLLTIDPASSMWTLYGYALLMGLGYSVSPAMTPILSGRFFIGRHFGIILGTLNTSYQAAGASGIWLAGYAHDLTGSYRLPLLGSIASALLALCAVWLAAPRKVGQSVK